MSNPYEPPNAEIWKVRPALGRGFYISLILSLLLFVFLPAFPLTVFIAIVGTVWGFCGIVMSWISVRGHGWLAALALSGFYVFLLFMTWTNLLARI
jgi:hypothetical protein